MQWCRIYDRWTTGILSLVSALGIATFWSFSVPPFGADAILLLSVTIGPNIPLVQLFLQVVVLLSKTFHNCS